MTMIELLLMLLLFLNPGSHFDVETSGITQSRADAIAAGAEFRHSLGLYTEDGICAAGEILARGFDNDAFRIVNAWLASPTHRAIVLNGWERIGIGESEGVVVVAFLRNC